jgi:hypothetical protein
MINARMRRFTGICALATIALWLAIFPLYTVGPLGSLYDGAPPTPLVPRGWHPADLEASDICLDPGCYLTSARSCAPHRSQPAESTR